MGLLEVTDLHYTIVLGDDFPREFEHLSFITLGEMQRIADALQILRSACWSISDVAPVVRARGWRANRTRG